MSKKIKTKEPKTSMTERNHIDPMDGEWDVTQAADGTIQAEFKKRSEAAHKAVRTREANKAAANLKMRKEFDAAQKQYAQTRDKIRAEVEKDALFGEFPIAIPPPTNATARRWYNSPEPHREMVCSALMDNLQSLRSQAANARARKLNNRADRMDEAADTFLCAINALGFRLESK